MHSLLKYFFLFQLWYWIKNLHYQIFKFVIDNSDISLNCLQHIQKRRNFDAKVTCHQPICLLLHAILSGVGVDNGPPRTTLWRLTLITAIDSTPSIIAQRSADCTHVNRPPKPAVQNMRCTLSFMSLRLTVYKINDNSLRHSSHSPNSLRSTGTRHVVFFAVNTTLFQQTTLWELTNFE